MGLCRSWGNRGSEKERLDGRNIAIRVTEERERAIPGVFVAYGRTMFFNRLLPSGDAGGAKLRRSSPAVKLPIKKVTYVIILVRCIEYRTVA